MNAIHIPRFPHPHGHSPVRPLAVVAAMSLSVLALGACTTPKDTTASAPPTAPQSAASATPAASATQDLTASPTPSGTPSDESTATSSINGNSWTKDRQQRSATPVTGKSLIFHDLRVGEHAGFYRVVVEFAGEGTPGWNVSWADTPVEQGRGRALPVTGSAYLDLAISGTAMPTESGQQALYYSGSPSLKIGPLDAYEDGTFEDITHVVIGMDKVRSFQVGTLTDPVRVVIDVQK